MIDFNSVSSTINKLENENIISEWISETISSEGFTEGKITYIFCDDEYLNKINLEFLNHDTLTDIISFDNRLGKQINGEIYISAERVRENAKIYKTNFKDELHRVMIHGILHFCGYNDKSDAETKIMRNKEEESLGRLTQI
ncbi:MAG: rRNA maturation RNase YbeY [Bacteroidetes bacterium]|nr:rRNA maturation RNase YbeY [Bacteroidota bacterium]